MLLSFYISNNVLQAGRGFVLVFRLMFLSQFSAAGFAYFSTYSLIQEASLKEVESLRKQIYRIKGTESASFCSLAVFVAIAHFAPGTDRMRWHQERPSQRT